MVLLILVLHTIVSICILILKMREARFWPKMKFEPIFFQVLWQFFNPKGSLLRAGGRGVWGEFRPPYKFWAKSFRIFSKAHRQLEKEAFGSPATRARQPIFGEISSRFEFNKARSGFFLFFCLIVFVLFGIIILKG